MSRIITVHLLHGHSGTPLVLRQSLEALSQAGYAIDLLAATSRDSGQLGELPGVTLHPLAGGWPAGRWPVLHFLLVQWAIFWRVLALANSGSVVYISSLLPAAAALAARCRGARVVYHLHEVAPQPAPLRRLLGAVAQGTAHQLLHASEHVRTTLALPTAQQQVVYSALPPGFLNQASRAAAYQNTQPFVVLMAAPLRENQGVPEFFALAAAMPALRFELVLGAAPAAVAAYAAQHPVPANLTLFPATDDMHPHYQRAAVVANLAPAMACGETCGKIILEAMSYGRPVLVPPVGGGGEASVHTQTGFAIDGGDLPNLRFALRLLHDHPVIYADMAAAARQRAAAFSSEHFAGQLRQVFQALRPVAAPAGRPAYAKLAAA